MLLLRLAYGWRWLVPLRVAFGWRWFVLRLGRGRGWLLPRLRGRF